MIARRWDIRTTPIASTAVAAAGRASGMAPTARATAATIMSAGALPRSTPIPNVTAARARITKASCLPNRASLRVNGVTGAMASSASCCTEPISVADPMATTTAFAVPRVTIVPEWTMFVRSASGRSTVRLSDDLATATDSPVSADSSHSRSRVSSTRPSAGTRSPASSTTTSPGTSSAEAILRRTPPRMTEHSVRTIVVSAAKAWRAFDSWTKPTTAFNNTTAKMTLEST